VSTCPFGTATAVAVESKHWIKVFG
jgi:hypothetical protein